MSGVLKNTAYYVDEHFPREIEDKRRPLYTVKGIAKQAGDECSLVVDKLYINYELYHYGRPVKSSKSYVLRNVHDPLQLKEERRNRWKNSFTHNQHNDVVVPEEPAMDVSSANMVPRDSEA